MNISRQKAIINVIVIMATIMSINTSELFFAFITNLLLSGKFFDTFDFLGKGFHSRT